MRPIALALLLLMAPVGARGQANPTPVAAAEKKGAAEGIKVHGHWTIEIRNPDGSLGSRREVENALVIWAAGGQTLLAGLLAHHYSDPIWFVSLYGPDINGNATGPCRHEGSPDPWPCSIAEPRAPLSGSEYFKNMAVGLPLQGGQQQRPAGTVELSGSATAALDGSIVRVAAGWYVAARNHFGDFTSKTLTPAIEVRAGQVIQVKVVYSFS
jgi:hypothetical protein